MKPFVLNVTKSLILTSLVIIFSNPAFAELSSKKIEQGIYNREFFTIKEFLAKLSKNDLKNYTLIYRSGSPQFATPTFPRVIVFSDSAKFLMAFNGSHFNTPTLEEPHFTIDIFEFDSQKQAYNPLALRFSKTPGVAPVLDRKPTTCVACHQPTQGIRPLRRTYISDLKPGVFGSIENQSSGKEKLFFEKYLSQKPTHARYSQLPDYDFTASQRLGNLLYVNQLRELAHRFKNLGYFNKLNSHRYALLAALECTSHQSQWDSQIENYLKPALQKSIKKPLISTTAEITLQKETAYENKVQIQRMASSEALPQTQIQRFWPVTDPAASAFYFLVSNFSKDKILMGEVLQTAVEADDHQGGLINLARFIYPYLLNKRTDKDLIALHEQYLFSNPSANQKFDISSAFGQKICPLLKERSLE